MAQETLQRLLRGLLPKMPQAPVTGPIRPTGPAPNPRAAAALDTGVDVVLGALGVNDPLAEAATKATGLGSLLGMLGPAGMVGGLKRVGGVGKWYKGMYPYDYTKAAGDDLLGPLIQPEDINRRAPFPTFGGQSKEVEGVKGFFAADPKVASRFAQVPAQRGAVYPVSLKADRIKTIDAKGEYAGKVQFGATGKEFQDAVASGDYDAIVIKNTKDEGDIAVALQGTRIKSSFAGKPQKRPQAVDKPPTKLLTGAGK